jgi:hypothetical protein
MKERKSGVDGGKGSWLETAQIKKFLLVMI